MKKLLILLLLLFTFNSKAQIEYIGQSITSIYANYDSIIYQSTDTIVVYDENYINFVSVNDTIDHVIKILPNSNKDIIEESFSSMIVARDRYFFEYDEGLYYTYIIELMDDDYFGLYLGRVE
jgi:hypothetical protein